jgi:phosphatidylglycerol:prolipoprotein diacylglycerol transferase
MLGEYFEVFGLKIEVYQTLIRIAFLAAICTFYFLKRDYPVSIIQGLAIGILAFLAGNFGATLLASVEFSHPLSDVFAKHSGSSFLGGLLLGSITLALAAKYFHFPVLPFFDELSVGMCIGIVFGRIGCFLSGDGCYGTPTSLPWGMQFPKGMIPTTAFVHPTPLYEAGFLLLLFIGALTVRSRLIHRPGLLATCTLLAYSLMRFTVEFIRINPKYGGLSQAQWISLSMSAVLVPTLFVLLWRPHRIDIAGDAA